MLFAPCMMLWAAFESLCSVFDDIILQFHIFHILFAPQRKHYDCYHSHITTWWIPFTGLNRKKSSFFFNIRMGHNQRAFRAIINGPLQPIAETIWDWLHSCMYSWILNPDWRIFLKTAHIVILSGIWAGLVEHYQKKKYSQNVLAASSSAY